LLGFAEETAGELAVQRRITVLALGTFAIGTESFVVAGLLPELADDLNVSVGRAGLLVSVFAVVYALSAPVTSTALARVERRRLLVVAMTVFAGSNFVAAIAPSYGLVAGARVLAALAAAAYTPVAVATAIQLLPETMRGRATSLVFGGLVVALVTSVPLGTYISHVGGWRATFVVVGGLSVISAIGVRMALPAGAGAAVGGLRDRLVPLRRAPVIVALLSAFVWMTGAFVFYTYISPLTTTATGWSTASLGPVLLVYGACAIVGNQLGGYATDSRLGDGRTLVAALATLAAAFIVFAVGVHTGPPVGIGIAVPAVAVTAIAGWALAPAQTYRMVALAPEAPTEVLSLNTTANYLGIGAGAAVGSVLADHSTVALAVAAAACSGLGLIGVRQVDRLRRNEAELTDAATSGGSHAAVGSP
jgi:DHA1 family inner membrane transport protein